MSNHVSNECLLSEILYLLSKKVSREDIEHILSLRYGKDIEIDYDMLERFCEERFKKSLNELLRWGKSAIEGLYNNCSKFRRNKIEEMIKGLDQNQISFLSYVAELLPWHSTNFPLVNMIVGSYNACSGAELTVNEVYDLLLRVGFIVRARIKEENLEQWLEINESDYINLISILGESINFKVTSSPSLNQLASEILPFFDLMIKLASPHYLFPRKQLENIYVDNFGALSYRKIKNLIWSDERYVYICPRAIDQLKLVLNKFKKAATRKIENIIKPYISSKSTYNSDIKIFESNDLALVVAPWIFFIEDSVFLEKLQSGKVYEIEKDLLIILTNQSIDKYVKHIEHRGKSNLSILSLNTEPALIYFASNSSSGYKKKVIRWVNLLGITVKDVTCEKLKEVFPLNKSNVSEFASKRYTVEAIKILLGQINSHFTGVEEIIDSYLEKSSIMDVARKVGYPSINCW